MPRVRACSNAAFAMFVRTPPGWTTVTCTGCPAASSSARRLSVNPRTPNLLAQYAVMRPWPMIPLRLETLTTCPSPEATRCGRNALVPWMTPNRLIARIRS